MMSIAFLRSKKSLLLVGWCRRVLHSPRRYLCWVLRQQLLWCILPLSVIIFLNNDIKVSAASSVEAFKRSFLTVRLLLRLGVRLHISPTSFHWRWRLLVKEDIARKLQIRMMQGIRIHKYLIGGLLPCLGLFGDWELNFLISRRVQHRHRLALSRSYHTYA